MSKGFLCCHKVSVKSSAQLDGIHSIYGAAVELIISFGSLVKTLELLLLLGPSQGARFFAHATRELIFYWHFIYRCNIRGLII